MSNQPTKHKTIWDYFEHLPRKSDLSIMDGCGGNPFESFKCKICKKIVNVEVYGVPLHSQVGEEKRALERHMLEEQVRECIKLHEKRYVNTKSK